MDIDIAAGAPPEGDPPIRISYGPSLTGPPSLGLVRRAVFSWLFARRHGGSFIVRIRGHRSPAQRRAVLRNTARHAALARPRLGRGPGRRRRLRALSAERAPRALPEVIRALLGTGELYESFSTPQGARYDNNDRWLSDREKAILRAQGQVPVLRLRLPDKPYVVDDLIRGEITFAAANTPDPVLVRSTGKPLFALASTVDDHTMGIMHVLRGEDLLPSVPRQLAVYEALERVGVRVRVPRFGHLSLMLCPDGRRQTADGRRQTADGRRLSRQTPESVVEGYRERGFLGGGVLPYLASLGWAFPEKEANRPADRLIAGFDVADVRPRPTRFDSDRVAAFNRAYLRGLSSTEFVRELITYLDWIGLPAEPDLVARAVPLVQSRSTLLSDAADLLRFLLVDDTSDAADLPAPDLVAAASTALSALPEWTADAIEDALRATAGRSPRALFDAVRRRVTGRPVSPPLGACLELLGRDRTLARLHT